MLEVEDSFWYWDMGGSIRQDIVKIVYANRLVSEIGVVLAKSECFPSKVDAIASMEAYIKAICD